jgi:hypothetical protein
MGEIQAFINMAAPDTYIFTTVTKGSEIQDGAFDIATGYGLDDRGVGVRVPVESRFLSYPHCPDSLCGHSAPI